jgi:hypothetical protein
MRISPRPAYSVMWFPVPSQDIYISDIITDPDGNMWFADEGDSLTLFARPLDRWRTYVSHRGWAHSSRMTAWNTSALTTPTGGKRSDCG